MAHCGLPVVGSRRFVWLQLGLLLALSKSLSGRVGVSSCTYRVRAITLEAINHYTSCLYNLTFLVDGGSWPVVLSRQRALYVRNQPKGDLAAIPPKTGSTSPSFVFPARPRPQRVHAAVQRTRMPGVAPGQGLST